MKFPASPLLAGLALSQFASSAPVGDLWGRSNEETLSANEDALSKRSDNYNGYPAAGQQSGVIPDFEGLTGPVLGLRPLSGVTNSFPPIGVPGVLENPFRILPGSNAVPGFLGSATGALPGIPINGLLGTLSSTTGSLPLLDSVRNRVPNLGGNIAPGQQASTWLPLGQATGSPATVAEGTLNSFPINGVTSGLQGAGYGVPSQPDYGNIEIPYGGATGWFDPNNLPGQGIASGVTQNLPNTPLSGLVGGVVQGAGNAIPQYGDQVPYTVGGIAGGRTGATQNIPIYGLKGETGQVPGLPQLGPINGWPQGVPFPFQLNSGGDEGETSGVPVPPPAVSPPGGAPPPPIDNHNKNDTNPSPGLKPNTNATLPIPPPSSTLKAQTTHLPSGAIPGSALPADALPTIAAIEQFDHHNLTVKVPNGVKDKFPVPVNSPTNEGQAHLPPHPDVVPQSGLAAATPTPILPVPTSPATPMPTQLRDPNRMHTDESSVRNGNNTQTHNGDTRIPTTPMQVSTPQGTNDEHHDGDAQE